MCSLYAVTKGRPAIRELARAMHDTTGNRPALPGAFPDAATPIVRTSIDGVRVLVMGRWGEPTQNRPRSAAHSLVHRYSLVPIDSQDAC